jgi:hypothetical protein
VAILRGLRSAVDKQGYSLASIAGLDAIAQSVGGADGARRVAEHTGRADNALIVQGGILSPRAAISHFRPTESRCLP